MIITNSNIGNSQRVDYSDESQKHPSLLKRTKSLQNITSEPSLSEKEEGGRKRVHYETGTRFTHKYDKRNLI